MHKRIKNIKLKIKNNPYANFLIPSYRKINKIVKKISNEIIRITRIPIYNFLYYRSFERKAYKGIMDIFENDYFDFPKLIFFDLGARSDIPKNLRPYKSALEIIGFEADKIECKRLNESNTSNAKFFPYVIGTGEKEYFLKTALVAASGVTETNNIFLKRLNSSIQNNLEVIKKTKLQTITLNNLIEHNKIPLPDFIKLDLEGYEADVLENSSMCFGENFLGLYTEIAFGCLKNPDNFARIDILCRKNNLHLYDINLNARSPRKVLEKRYKFKNGLAYEVDEAYGQRIGGDILYLRDPINDYHNKVDFNWNDDNVIKLLLIYESYDLNDCAIELLDFYGKMFKTNLPTEKLKNLLVPRRYNPYCLSYEAYIESLKNIHGNEQRYSKSRIKT